MKESLISFHSEGLGAPSCYHNGYHFCISYRTVGSPTTTCFVRVLFPDDFYCVWYFVGDLHMFVDLKNRRGSGIQK